jgi:hypothetical protein
LVFRVAALQEKPRFFIAFFVQIMKQGGVGVARQLFGQFVEAAEERQQVWFGICSGHRLDRVFQFNERGQQIFFKGIFHGQILSCQFGLTMCF